VVQGRLAATRRTAGTNRWWTDRYDGHERLAEKEVRFIPSSIAGEGGHGGSRNDGSRPKGRDIRKGSVTSRSGKFSSRLEGKGQGVERLDVDQRPGQQVLL